MRKTLFLFIAAFLYSVAAVCQFPERIIKVTPLEALDVAVKACSDNKSQYDYFISETSVKKDNSLFHAVFVDKKPGAGWEHPCAYVYVKTSRLSSEATPYHIVEEATHPKGTIKMRPIRVHDRYGSNSKFKPRVVKLNANAGEKNSFSGNTYAVILSGGLNMESNEERYWNDCSFIYQTLRNRYDVPKNNIKVIMSDGTDPSEDMKNNNGEYVSSPLDLDYDGIADIEYASTKENVKNVLKSLCAKLTDKDHLLLYVIDHGGYDTQAKQSYICLWNEERLYPDELNEWLSTGDTGYINILMGQCHSGGFVKALKGNNRIVATACSEDELSYGCEELPFDEFVYHWTSALNGFDAEGNLVTAQTDTLSTGALKPVTMIKAFEYANEHDMYTGGRFPYAEETPCLSYLKNSTAEDLALDTIPDVVGLYIRSYKNDNGVRPFDRNSVSWNSPDIWGRFNEDGIENQQMQNIRFSEDHSTCYIYVKVRNRGVKPYKYIKNSPQARYVHTAWAKSAFAITEDCWRGLLKKDPDISGGHVGYVPLRSTINPGDSTIVCISWKPENGLKYDLIDASIFHACLLAYITNNRNNMPDFWTQDTGIAKIWQTNKMAQKNLMIPKVNNDVYARIYMGELRKNLDNIYLYNVSDPYDKNRVYKNEISVKMSPTMFQEMKRKGFHGSSIVYCNDPDNRILMKADDSKIGGIEIKKGNNEYIDLECNLVADQILTDTLTRTINIALTDAGGSFLGGESIMVINAPRDRIDFDTSVTVDDGGNNMLSVSGISEDVTCEWYDENGKYVGSGSSISIPSGFADRKYTVKVKSSEDGAVRYETLNVPKNGVISNIDTRYSNGLKVFLNIPAPDNTVVRVVSSGSTCPVIEKAVETGKKSCMIDIPNMISDVYQVTLLENENIIDVRKVRK